MELDAGAEEHTKQYPQDDGIWKNAPVERQIHEESIRAMKITMAEVNAKITAVALATIPVAKTQQ